jgi:hypothetical protein
MSRSLWSSLVVSSALVFACAPTTLRSGFPAGRTAPGYDGKWHSSFVFGLVDGGERYDLAQICPKGWSEVRADMSFVQGVILVLSVFVYAPSRVTIVCANTGDGPPAPEGAGPLPPFEWVTTRPKGPSAGGSRRVPGPLVRASHPLSDSPDGGRE